MTEELARMRAVVDTESFRVDPVKRTVTGLLVPFGEAAKTDSRWRFSDNSISFDAANINRIKLDVDHEDGTELGVALKIEVLPVGLWGTFRIARTPRGDEILALAEDGIYDGFSVEVAIPKDGWEVSGDYQLIKNSKLHKVAITSQPAFHDARVTTVVASQERIDMTDKPVDAPAVDGVAIAAAVTEGLSATFKDFTEAIKALAVPQESTREVVKASEGLTATTSVGREESVYLMNGNGHSLVRDAWKSRTEQDHEATARLRKFQMQTEDNAKRAMRAQFAVTTGNANEVIPPGYRPDLYVTQLMQDRPLVSSVSRGTLSDATPFNIPKYVSSSGASALHVEGVNPSDASLDLGIITVVPSAISGKFSLTREIVDSANPAIDAIATAAMREAYSQQTEGIVYTELNGTNGVGGTITSGRVPSGAQATTSSGQGDELLAATRSAMAVYPFVRFGRANRAHISQEATTEFATAVDGNQRPLLPYVGAQNSVGTGDSLTGGYNVDGLTFAPTWSMTGNAAGDADVLFFNSADVWAWESPTLMFRFEERNGPALIDLAMFGYFAARVLRPQGLAGIRHTHS